MSSMSSPTLQSKMSGSLFGAFESSTAVVSATPALEEMCCVVASIVKDLKFTFAKDALIIRQLDEDQICYVEARFPLEIHNFKVGYNFTVAAKQMLIVLRDVALDDVVHIIQDKNAEYIKIVAVSMQRRLNWKIPIIRRCTEELSTPPLSLPFSVGIKVACLKAFLAVARKLDSTADIKISLFREKLDVKKQVYFSMETIDASDGPSMGCAVYRTVNGRGITDKDLVPAQEEKTPMCKISPTEVIYSAIFPKMYLRRITKNMNKDVFATLSMAPDNPMHIVYEIGSCAIRFMLASTCL